MRRPRLRRASRGAAPGGETADATAAAVRHPTDGAAALPGVAPASAADEVEGPGDVPLDASHVWLAYQGMLGRTPSAREIADRLASLTRPAELVALILASDEYEQKSPPQPTFGERTSVINWWHPESAAHTLVPGTLSRDRVAIVGREGTLFLHGGTNSALDQFVGGVAMAEGWAEGWADLMRRRTEAMSTGGRRSVSLVVPDKLAICADRFPGALETAAPRPVERLLGELALPLLYPAADLLRAQRRWPVYLLADSHLTFRGNYVVYAATMAEVGVDALPMDDLAELHDYSVSGDLGSRFDPPVVEIATVAVGLGSARITEDNHEAVVLGGGHIGSRRVYRNDAAPDPRCVVLFGDSYGFASTSYQGLAWFLAQTFADVHFVWTPFGWDPDYADRAGADLVISETAERFVPRVPAFSIDVDAICAAAVSRGPAVDPDAVFSDRPAGG